MKTLRLLLAGLALGLSRLACADDLLEAPAGWQYASDDLATEALEVEILRNVGKQTQEADYPEEARRWTWSGTTLVHVSMDADGSMKEVSVQRTSGFRVLDDQALKMVRRVPFTRMPDRPRDAITVTVPIGFYFAPVKRGVGPLLMVGLLLGPGYYIVAVPEREPGQTFTLTERAARWTWLTALSCIRPPPGLPALKIELGPNMNRIAFELSSSSHPPASAPWPPARIRVPAPGRSADL
jgi:TonB family protein